MQTGILLTTPGKNRFWHPCKDVETGIKEMTEAHAGDNRYGLAWGHPESIVEFGKVGPDNKFELITHVSGPKAAA